MNRLFLTTSIVSIMLLAFAGVSYAADLTWDASLDVDGDDIWENTGTTPGYDWGMSSAQSPVTGISDGVTLVNAAYQYPAAGAIQGSFIGFIGNLPASDITYEMWFRPADLVGKHILFETGGSSRGMEIALDGDSLHFIVQSNSGNRAKAQTTLDAGSVNQFNHLVGVADNVNDDNTGDFAIDLYLNGVLMDSSSQTAIAWYDGGGQAGLGKLNATSPTYQEVPSFTDYDGQIGIFNMYKAALTGTEIAGLYNAGLVPEPVSALLMSMGALALVGIRRRR